MTEVVVWFFQPFLLDFKAAHPRTRWPNPATELGMRFYDEWIERLEAARVELATALRAGRRVPDDGAPPRDHLRRLLAAIEDEGRQSAKVRRIAEDEQSAAAEAALRAAWDRLAPGDRASIEAEVRAGHPGVLRFPSIFQAMCLCLFDDRRQEEGGGR